MKTDPFTRIEKATVTLLKKGGQGILVKNQMILTAAHCVDYDFSGAMVLGEYFYEEIETRSGKFKVAPLCVEPMSDIAVLGAMDDQECSFDFEQFNEFSRKTLPIKICRTKLETTSRIKIFIFNHKKRWITGYAQVGPPDLHMLMVEADDKIEGGTSGSAIVNEKGEIIGIVSNSSDHEIPHGTAPRPLLTLPRWICHQI